MYATSSDHCGPDLKLPAAVQDLLCCPICHRELNITAQELTCANPACKAVFPVTEGLPVLINEANSVFSFDDFLAHRSTTFSSMPKFMTVLSDHLPWLTYNYKAKHNYRRFVEWLLQKKTHPTVLTIGGSIMGAGMDILLNCPGIRVIESDVSFGPRTALIADAHDLPFKDGSLDGIVIQAVLNCVVDPYRCVDEIHRVLNDDGLVYAETSFVQPVLDGRYDFTRFTYLGHRRLFRKFKDIESGGVGGPGMAMGLLYRAFLLSFARSKFARSAASTFARLSAFWLKYIDYFLVNRPEALDATSGCYFLGQKSPRALSDHELMGLYRGSLPKIGENIATLTQEGLAK
ncbi:MAG TPA: methyltransferase domain-containing protein [Tepidisphaeraceae bacterium]|nr:methyltransferase domain-containing protein [Tepidisphaeraceae bacterium]